MEYQFEGKIWLYDGPAAWHFVTIPKDISAEIKTNFGLQRPGFGSIRVEAKIGDTEWRTSIFPDKKRDAYLLPIKSEVRKSEGVIAGSVARITIQLII